MVWKRRECSIKFRDLWGVRQDPLLVRSHLSILHLPSPLALLTWQVLMVIHQACIGQVSLIEVGTCASRHVYARAAVDRDPFG
jgi:hypothetical protein